MKRLRNRMVVSGVGAVSAVMTLGITDARPAPAEHLRWPVVGLHDVSVSSQSDMWAVGDTSHNGRTTQTLAMHRGSSGGWTTVPAVDPGESTNALYGVDDLNAQSAWAVGSYRSPNISEQPLIEYWNGQAWTQQGAVSVAQCGRLVAVAAIAADDVWAVGYYLHRGGPYPIAEHWNGKRWRVSLRTTPAAPTGVGSTMYAQVTALSSTDVWIIGERSNYGGSMFIDHWDGHTWSRMALPPNFSIMNVADILADDNIIAAGSDDPRGGNHLKSARWDGARWKFVDMPDGGLVSGISDLGGTGPDDVWAVGHWSATVRGEDQSLIEHWDGSEWSIVACPSLPGRDWLSAIDAISPELAFAVGAWGHHFDPLIQAGGLNGWQIVVP